MAWPRHPLDALVAARGLLFPWAPVMVAVGIGGYFALPVEPGAGAWAAAGLALAAALALWRVAGLRWKPLVMALALVLAGALAAGLRTNLVAAPVLARPYYGPVAGRIVGIDRSSSDRMRLTLDQVRLDRVAPARTPGRVRISLQGRGGGLVPEVGQAVMVTARLAPPDGPVEPGGFDFRRMAWFQGLGAVGYTATPVVLWAPAEGPGLTRWRLSLAAAIRARISGEAGAFAAAVATGDRSGMSQETVANLRASNLAHLLAISGLHMGLLTAFVFSALRMGLALVPPLALRLPAKKIAAMGALAAAAVYLALSGGSVSTQRAFIMVAVMLGAVLADRRALTLRSVALAALLILAIRPESLTAPGFQMSFAATTALVAAFGALQAWPRHAKGRGGWLHGLARGALMLVFSSAVAGLATAPIAAATFNRVAEYGLLANLLSVPVMGFVVVPGAVMAAVLAPVGLAAPGLWAMGLGARWILGVAAWIAGLHGAVLPVASPPAVVLPLMAFGALWLVLWRGWLRWPGLGVIAVALVLWAGAARPLLLISGDGRLAGVMTPDGRALSRARGAGFVARNWLAADGDGADQPRAGSRAGFTGPRGERRFAVAGRAAVVLTGKGAVERVQAACADAVLVVLDAPLLPGKSGQRKGPDETAAGGEAPRGRVRNGCLVLDAKMLAASGAIAIRPGKGGTLHITTAAGLAGRRPWTGPTRPLQAGVLPLDLPALPRHPAQLAAVTPGPGGNRSAGQ